MGNKTILTKSWSKWYIIIFRYLLFFLFLKLWGSIIIEPTVMTISNVQSVMIDWDMRWLCPMSLVLIVILISLHDQMLCCECMPVMLAKIFVHNTGTLLVLHNEICLITFHYTTATTYTDQMLFSNIDL